MFSAVKVLLAPSDFQARIWRWITAVIPMGSPAPGVSPLTPRSAGNSVTSQDVVSTVLTQASGTFTSSLRIKSAMPGRAPQVLWDVITLEAVYRLLYVTDQSIRAFFWGGGVLFCLFWVHMNVGFWEWSLVPPPPFSSAKGKSDPHLLVPGFHYQPVKWRHSAMSDSGWSPTRLLHPWDFPGMCTGVDCHFLLQGIFQTRDWTRVSCIADRSFTEFFLTVSKVVSQDVQFFIWPTWEAAAGEERSGDKDEMADLMGMTWKKPFYHIFLL